MDVEDNEEIELENNFNIAEDEWKTKPDEAFNLFSQVIEKEKLKPLDSRKWSFKSYNVHRKLKYIVFDPHGDLAKN